TAVFLGDLVDRGPDTPGVLRTAMGMTASGAALCVPGKPEARMLRALRGRDVRVSHGLAESLAQLAAEPGEFSGEVIEFLDGLVSHYVLDSGRLVVAHAGLREEMHGRASAAVRAFALYGETTGETDEFGLPVRYPWAQDYRGKAAVVYGHTPVPEAVWVHDTVCLHTRCGVCGRGLRGVARTRGYGPPGPARGVSSPPPRPPPGPPPGPGPPDAGAPGARARDGAARPAAAGAQPPLLDVADVIGRR